MIIYNMDYVRIRNINAKMIEGINDEHYNMFLVFGDVSAVVQSNPVLQQVLDTLVSRLKSWRLLVSSVIVVAWCGLLCKGGRHHVPLHKVRGGQVLGGRDRAAGAALFAGEETKRVDYDCHICKDVT